MEFFHQITLVFFYSIWINDHSILYHENVMTKIAISIQAKFYYIIYQIQVWIQEISRKNKILPLFCYKIGNKLVGQTEKL